MCSEWRDDFSAFLHYMGTRPSESHSLDRWPNPKGNYEPGNVRWATIDQQNNNRQSNRNIEFDGKTQNIKQWADEFGISRKTLASRLNRGMKLPEALAKDDLRVAA